MAPGSTSTMLTTATESSAEVEDAFNLDLRVIIDVPSGHPLAACGDGTNDGCDPTCASACVTGGV
jgi:FxLD family lantipeptide